MSTCAVSKLQMLPPIMWFDLLNWSHHHTVVIAYVQGQAGTWLGPGH